MIVNIPLPVQPQDLPGSDPLGHGVLSLAVSVVRQLIVLLPAAFVLARLGGLHVVWWSFPFAELFSTTLTALFLYWVYKKEVAPMRETK